MQSSKRSGGVGGRGQGSSPPREGPASRPGGRDPGLDSGHSGPSTLCRATSQARGLLTTGEGRDVDCAPSEARAPVQVPEAEAQCSPGCASGRGEDAVHVEGRGVGAGGGGRGSE